MNLFLNYLLFFSFFSPSPEHIRAEILEKFDQKQEDNGFLHLRRLVLGPGSFHGYMLHYYGIKNLTQDEARSLIVTNIEDILSQLNAAEKRVISTYYRYPLMPEDIKMGYFNFKNWDGDYSSPPYVACISNYRDVIEYRLFTGTDFEDCEIVVESYNEAYEKVYGKPRQPLCEPRKLEQKENNGLE